MYTLLTYLVNYGKPGGTGGGFAGLAYSGVPVVTPDRHCRPVRDFDDDAVRGLHQ